MRFLPVLHLLFADGSGRATGALPGTEWYIYDVGGSRSSRQHWIPYFDDVQAIIFLAPLAFNLTLDEDPKVNRLVRRRFLSRGARSLDLMVRDVV